MSSINNTIFDIAIIGAGPAGLFAAFQAGMQDLNAIIIDTLDIIGGQCSVLYPDKPIYDVAGQISITGRQLVDNLYTQMSRFNHKILLGQQIENCNFNSEDKIFSLQTNAQQIIKARTVIIASGCGSFVPNKPQIENLEEFEKQDVIHYLVKNPQVYCDKTIAIAGGGDSAVDWAINLSNQAKKIYFIHRRDNFRAHPESIKRLYSIVESGKIEFKIPYVGCKIYKNQNISCLELKNFNQENQIDQINIDYFLAFFGLKNEIGAIANWGLKFNKNKLNVDNYMSSNIAGIFAIGDICDYPGKTKLLVSCFHEACVAINSISNYLVENFNRKAISFTYSTSKF